jgi:hypothetical protein
MQEMTKSLKQSKLVPKEIPIISLMAGQYQYSHLFSPE